MPSQQQINRLLANRHKHPMADTPRKSPGRRADEVNVVVGELGRRSVGIQRPDTSRWIAIHPLIFEPFFTGSTRQCMMKGVLSFL